MTEIIPQQFHYTLQFFQDCLKNSNENPQCTDGSFWLESLSTHLKMDGYEIRTTVEQSTGFFASRRSLEGEVSGDSFYTDLVLIFLCVLCAGLASGLTQVAYFLLFWMSTLLLFFLSFFLSFLLSRLFAGFIIIRFS
jgi:hypothetical protein